MFLFQHGWAFSDRCWQGWLPELVSYRLANRGYWGTAFSLDDENIQPGFVLVCHSLGLHFLSSRLLSQASMLVVISGFAHFHGANPFAGRFSRKHVRKMLVRLSVDPAGLIQDFHRDCELPWQLDERAENRSLLANDLSLLDTSYIDQSRFAELPPVLQLHGREDRIVRPERAEELAAILGTIQLTFVDGSGHGLPFAHPQVCLALIRKFSEKFC